MRRIILIALSGAFLGACSLAVNDVPQTTPPGKFKLGLGLGNYLTYSSGEFISLPLAGVSGRYGLNYNTDIGFRVFEAGFGLEVKRAFSENLALALGTNLGMNTRSKQIFYQLYGTLLYGMQSIGTIPYFYVRPILNGYLGTPEEGSGFTLPAGMAIQAGFGYHGDPTSLLQPVGEVGVYVPVSGSASLQPTLILSLGLNVQFGE